MARSVFSRGVLGGVWFAILLVAFSGCSQTVEKTTPPDQETRAEKEAALEQDATVEETAARIENEDIETLVEETVVTPPEATSEEATEEPAMPEEENAEENAGASPAAKENKENAVVQEEESVIEVIEEPEVDLGDPLLDNLNQFVPLQENRAAWVNKDGKEVAMVGRVVQRNAPLEMFICQKNTKEHESVLAVDTSAQVIHAALLLIGAEPGHPVQYQPEYQPATGTPIAIQVIWKDADGKIQKAKAQEWIKNVKTNEPMSHDWVFAGSGFWENKETGQRMYLAEQGDFICVSNFPTAMLDLPIKSSDQNDALLFQAWEEHIPQLGTPVTIVLTPIETQEKE